MEDNSKHSKSSTQLNIELNDKLAEGEYSNLVMIAHSAEEFILDFIRVMPGVPTARVKNRVIVTPHHARRFLRALHDNIEKYEAIHGEIEEREQPGQSIRFGGMAGQA